MANGMPNRVESLYYSQCNSNASTSSESTSSESTSRSIPITKYIHRTPSELQLYEETAIADWRDYCMYTRIVGGISRQQMMLKSDIELRYQNDETLANIIRTRHTPDEYMTSNDKIMYYLHQATDDDDDRAPNLTEVSNYEQGVFVLDM
jgi:hypothetical protein